MTARVVDVTTYVTRLEALARKVRRLDPPDHRNPDAYHVTKSEIARELVEIAHGLAGSR